MLSVMKFFYGKIYTLWGHKHGLDSEKTTTQWRKKCDIIDVTGNVNISLECEQ